MGAIDRAGVGARVIVLALGMVPAIDATGLVALESALERLRRAKKLVVIAGPFPEPRSVFERANLEVRTSMCSSRILSNKASGWRRISSFSRRKACHRQASPRGLRDRGRFSALRARDS